jgi:hypothetical protein
MTIKTTERLAPRKAHERKEVLERSAIRRTRGRNLKFLFCLVSGKRKSWGPAFSPCHRCSSCRFCSTHAKLANALGDSASQGRSTYLP